MTSDMRYGFGTNRARGASPLNPDGSAPEVTSTTMCGYSVSDPSGQVKAVQRAGHGHVGEQHPNVSPGFEKGCRIVGRGGLQHLEDVVLKRIDGDGTNKRIILDNQDTGDLRHGITVTHGRQQVGWLWR